MPPSSKWEKRKCKTTTLVLVVWALRTEWIGTGSKMNPSLTTASVELDYLFGERMCEGGLVGSLRTFSIQQ